MEPVFELAGWCLAEAVLNMSQIFQAAEGPAELQGAVLLPSLVIHKNGKQAHIVFDEVSEETFEKVERLLSDQTPSEAYAVLVKDGYVTIDNERSDAIILEGYYLVEPRQSFCLAVPYTPQHGDEPFTVHQPTLLEESGFDSDTIDIGGAFARGRDQHAEGAAAWRAAYQPTA